VLHDAVGNRASMTAMIPALPALGGQTTYQHDLKNQLLQEQSTRNGSYTNVFGYDAAGNPTTFKGAVRTCNVNNQDTAQTYDNNGNPTLYNGVALTFDAENRLTSVGSVLTAGYTGDAMRAWKQTASGLTYFLYDGTLPVVEMDATGAVTAVNTFGPNGLLSRRSGGSRRKGAVPQGIVGWAGELTSRHAGNLHSISGISPKTCVSHKEKQPMKRFATVLTLAMAALTLSLGTFALVHAYPYNNANHNSGWWDDWKDCKYNCRIGNKQGKLFIDSTSPHGDCCEWEASFKFGNKSYHCEGYAKRGGFCYFKMDGSDEFCCLGQLSYNLKQMGGDYCSFDHCSYGHWSSQCYSDSHGNPSN
jgi:hypothetical protein